MPDDFNLDEFDDDEVDNEQDEATLVRRLRGVIKDSKRQNKELQQQMEVSNAAVKKLAFIEAKLPDEPQVKFFLDHYEGEYTPEAIREAAATNGFIMVDNTTTEEVNAVQGMMDANRGSTSMAAPGTDRELTERINAVQPGPNASKQIRDIMIAAGRYETDE